MFARWIALAGAGLAALAWQPHAHADESYTNGPSFVESYGYGGSFYPTYDYARHETGRAATLLYGRLVVAGDAYGTNGAESSDVILTRLGLDGRYDTSFDGNRGVVAVQPVPGAPVTVSDLVRLTGNRLLVAGYTSDPANTDALRLFVTRTQANGTLDTTFAGTGARSVAIGDSTGFNEPHIAVQPDGKIVIASTRAAPSGLGYCIIVMRWLADGADDPGFGRNGSVCITRNEVPYVAASGVALQADGRIVIGGLAFRTVTPQNADFAAVRLLANGDIDSTFGTGGWTLVGFDLPGGTYDYASAVKLDSTGRILLAGRASTSTTTSPSQIAVARLAPNGLPDATFGTGGRAVVTSNSARSVDEYANDIAVLDDGSVLVAGRLQYPNGGSNISVGGAVLLRDDGSRDPRFGVDGIYLPRPTNGTASPGSEFFRIVTAGNEFYLVGDGSGELQARAVVNHFAVTKLARSLFRGGFEVPAP